MTHILPLSRPTTLYYNQILHYDHLRSELFQHSSLILTLLHWDLLFTIAQKDSIEEKQANKFHLIYKT